MAEIQADEDELDARIREQSARAEPADQRYVYDYNDGTWSLS